MARYKLLNVLGIQLAEVCVPVAIIIAHSDHDTVFQSTDNLGIMVAPAKEPDGHENATSVACSLALLIVGGTAMAQFEPGYDRVTGRHFASRSEVIAPHAMAATSQPLATQIALEILKAGGHAVDAAIAANAALGSDGTNRQRYWWRSVRYCMGCPEQGTRWPECVGSRTGHDDARILQPTWYRQNPVVRGRYL